MTLKKGNFMKQIVYEVMKEAVELGQERSQLIAQQSNDMNPRSFADYLENGFQATPLDVEIRLLTKHITSLFRALNLKDILRVQAIMYLGLYKDYDPDAATETILKEQMKETGIGNDPETEINQIVVFLSIENWSICVIEI